MKLQGNARGLSCCIKVTSVQRTFRSYPKGDENLRIVNHMGQEQVHIHHWPPSRSFSIIRYVRKADRILEQQRHTTLPPPLPTNPIAGPVSNTPTQLGRQLTKLPTQDGVLGKDEREGSVPEIESAVILLLIVGFIREKGLGERTAMVYPCARSEIRNSAK